MYRVCQGLKLVLASASPRRQEFLSRLGLNFLVRPAQVDEALVPGEPAIQAARRLVRIKAAVVGKERPKAAVLAADTLVVLEGKILGKPRDLADAQRMLQMLSGLEHQVVTGYCLNHGGREHCGEAVSSVRFRDLRPAEIEAYVASGEPLGKAGAYAVQGLAAALVAQVSGSYSNVVGLPLAEVVEMMLALSIIEPWGEVEA
ncbi:dTTP/UTP pyrophosphatase [Desulfarculales bacterium]